MMRHLLLVRGLPGSGKTTLSNVIQTNFQDPNTVSAATGTTVLHSADDFFTNGGFYKFDASKIKTAHKECRRKTTASLKQGNHVIVHNTFTQNWEMDPYTNIASQCGAVLNVIDVYDGGCSDEQLAARCVHRVPLRVIERMHQRWETRRPSDMEVHNYGTRCLKASQKRRLLVIRGLPARGKTTLALKIASEKRAEENEYALHSTHDFGMGAEGSTTQTHVDNSMQNGFNVIVHDDYPGRWRMAPLEDLAAARGVEFQVIDIFDGGCSNEELAARSTHGATPDLIEAMRRHFEPEDPALRAAWHAARFKPYSLPSFRP